MNLTTEQARAMRSDDGNPIKLPLLCVRAGLSPDMVKMRLVRGKPLTSGESEALGSALVNALPEGWLRSVMMERSKTNES